MQGRCKAAKDCFRCHVFSSQHGKSALLLSELLLSKWLLAKLRQGFKAKRQEEELAPSSQLPSKHLQS